MLACDFFKRCWSCTNEQTWKPASHFLFLFFRPWDMAEITILKNTTFWKATMNPCLKKKDRLSICLQMWSKYSYCSTRLNFRSKIAKLSGASQNVSEIRLFFPFFVVITWWLATYIWSRVMVISLDGWRIGQWNLYRCFVFLVHCLHEISPWLGTTNFIRI